MRRGDCLPRGSFLGGWADRRAAPTSPSSSCWSPPFFFSTDARPFPCHDFSQCMAPPPIFFFDILVYFCPTVALVHFYFLLLTYYEPVSDHGQLRTFICPLSPFPFLWCTSSECPHDAPQSTDCGSGRGGGRCPLSALCCRCCSGQLFDSLFCARLAASHG